MLPRCPPVSLPLQFLDGSYRAFVASVKLEAAFVQISTRDANEEEEAAEAAAAEEAAGSTAGNNTANGTRQAADGMERV